MSAPTAPPRTSPGPIRRASRTWNRPPPPLPPGQQDPPFSEAERAAIQYARELTRTADASDTREALQEHFSSEQIVELTLIVAMANFTNRFNNGLELKPEE